MTSLDKMYFSNAKIRRFMEGLGMQDIKIFPMTRYSKDFWIEGAAFDGIARWNNKIVLFQNKSNKTQTKKEVEHYKYISEKYGILAMWFNNVDYEGVECKQLSSMNGNESSSSILEIV